MDTTQIAEREPRGEQKRRQHDAARKDTFDDVPTLTRDLVTGKRSFALAKQAGRQEQRPMDPNVSCEDGVFERHKIWQLLTPNVEANRL